MDLNCVFIQATISCTSTILMTKLQVLLWSSIFKGLLFWIFVFISLSINRILSVSSRHRWKVFGLFSSFASPFSPGSSWLFFPSPPSFSTSSPSGWNRLLLLCHLKKWSLDQSLGKTQIRGHLKWIFWFCFSIPLRIQWFFWHKNSNNAIRFHYGALLKTNLGI